MAAEITQQGLQEKIMKKKLLLILSIVTASVMLFSAGCARSFSGYDVYQQHAGEGIYDFEYPNHYNVTLVELYEDQHYSCLHVYSMMERIEKTQSHWEIEVSKDRYLNSSDIYAQIKLHASSLPNLKYENDRLIKIGEYDATVITYTYRLQRTDYQKNIVGLKDYDMRTQVAFFQRDGKFWKFTEDYCPETNPDDVTWYQHFLDTIKIY